MEERLEVIKKSPKEFAGSAYRAYALFTSFIIAPLMLQNLLHYTLYI